jgi:phosphatidate phosphatase APP1
MARSASSVRRARAGAAGLRVVLAVEDALQAALVGLFGLLGRHRVTVLPFVGHGSPDRLHVRARVVLGSRALPAPGPEPVPGPRPPPWRTLRASLGRFLTVELPGCPVTVLAPGGGRVEARADREGYVDVLVEVPGLAPGWHELTIAASWRGHTAQVPAPVLVVDPASPYALVSDVDDTVVETGVTRGLELLRLTLLTEVTDRVPLPGAAELYQAFVRASGAPVLYLSTSPWNLHDLLTRFIELRGFPRGPLLLTDWGPGRAGFLRIAAEEHKRTLIRQVLADHPGLAVVLIGDTGQIDPEIYAAVATETPHRVHAVYVRRTPGISAARAAEVAAIAARVSAAGVPMVPVDDSLRIAEHAASIGLLDPAAVAAVRAACAG